MYPVSVITAAPLVALGRFETRRQWRPHARRALRVHLCVASAQESTVYKVAGMGGAGLDYLAVVSAYPKPDQKIRTESFEGGGNCGNALTGAAKLGLQPWILTKLGDDSIGTQTLLQLESEGINTSCVVVAQGRPSGFTYIIVDAAGDTRTCIHTPADPLDPSEVTSENIERSLDGARLVYFDGRLTEAAVRVAQAAKEKAIPVLVEAERLRPNLEQLIDLADIVVTSKNFPEDFSGEACLGDALVSMLHRFQNAQLLVTTLGAKGSVAIQRHPMPSQNMQKLVLEDHLQQCWKELAATETDRDEPDCVSNNRTPIWCGNVHSSDAFYAMLKRSVQSNQDVKAAAKERAREAAIADGKPASHEHYSRKDDDSSSHSSAVRLTVATAACIKKEAIVDTTGAGDAFFAAVLYGIVHQLPLPEMLKLSGVVAACKCTEIGARTGQPSLTNLKRNYRTSDTSVH